MHGPSSPVPSRRFSRCDAHVSIEYFTWEDIPVEGRAALKTVRSAGPSAREGRRTVPSGRGQTVRADSERTGPSGRTVPP